MPSRRIAVIDIGTVTCRLWLGDVDDAGTHDVLRRCEICDLGEGVDATHLLKAQAIARVVACVATFRTDIDTHPAARPTIVVAQATSAARDAENADELVDALAAIGVELQVIPGETEARLSFSGATLDRAGKPVLVADIGGGSTELVAGIGGGAPVARHSFDIGCRRVTERFLHDDPPTAAQMDDIRRFTDPAFRGFIDELRAASFRPEELIAVAGTATSVVSVHRRMADYDSSLVHGVHIDAATLEQVTGNLSGMPLERRRRVVGLQPGRAPVIVAGLVILRSVMDVAGFDGFTVSDNDILQGTALVSWATSCEAENR